MREKYYRRARMSGLWDRILEHLAKITKENNASIHDTKSGIKELFEIPKFDAPDNGGGLMRSLNSVEVSDFTVCNSRAVDLFAAYILLRRFSITKNL